MICIKYSIELLIDVLNIAFYANLTHSKSCGYTTRYITSHRLWFLCPK